MWRGVPSHFDICHNLHLSLYLTLCGWKEVEGRKRKYQISKKNSVILKGRSIKIMEKMFFPRVMSSMYLHLEKH